MSFVRRRYEADPVHASANDPTPWLTPGLKFKSNYSSWAVSRPENFEPAQGSTQCRPGTRTATVSVLATVFCSAAAAGLFVF